MGNLFVFILVMCMQKVYFLVTGKEEYVHCTIDDDQPGCKCDDGFTGPNRDIGSVFVWQNSQEL